MSNAENQEKLISVSGVLRRFSNISTRREFAMYFYTCERCGEEFRNGQLPSLNAPYTAQAVASSAGKSQLPPLPTDAGLFAKASFPDNTSAEVEERAAWAALSLAIS